MPTIPIRREAGYRIDTTGRHAGGQFYAAECILPRKRPDADPRDDTGRRCYEYLLQRRLRHLMTRLISAESCTGGQVPEAM